MEHAAIKTFEAECRLFAIRVVEKLRKRILTARAVNFLKKASCLDPKQMSKPLAKSVKKLVLDLSASKILSNDQGDQGINKYRELISKEEVKAKLICYKPSEPLDSFFFRKFRYWKI